MEAESSLMQMFEETQRRVHHEGRVLVMPEDLRRFVREQRAAAEVRAS